LIDITDILFDNRMFIAYNLIAMHSILTDTGVSLRIPEYPRGYRRVVMLLDLREIIGVPGGKVKFDFEPDMSDAASGSVSLIKKPARAAGSVTNNAGVLTLSANVDTVCVCVCARCLKEFEIPVHKSVSAILTEGGEGETPDAYFLQGDKVDVNEIVVTEFILDMDDTLLCSEDCAGLCQGCGSDLNIGPCECKKEVDPRLAVLSQLLEDQNK